MIDYARITVIAGDGGRGAGSFTHIKGKRRGKADGGDGGRGGNVYFEATRDLNTLEPFRYVKDYKAANGQNGLSRLRRGGEGADLVIRVPVGTQIKIENGKLKVENYDLIHAGQKVLIVRGGEGGRGNAHLRDEYGRRPLRGESGGFGETSNLTLELKLIADVGLIGLPNSGKSTLLSALTSAKPAIAPYPFTTLEPNLGVLESYGIVGKWDSRKKEPTILPSKYPKNLILADIPGLIEGASRGRGLGDLFLRHIERTKILVHLIDASTGSDKWHDYQVIRKELKEYSKNLAKKKEIVVLTKIDLIGEQKLKELLDLFKSKKKKVLAISALRSQGLSQLIEELLKITAVSAS